MGTEPAETIFRKALLQEEELRWIGKPDSSKHFTSSDVFLIPCSALLCIATMPLIISLLRMIFQNQPISLLYIVLSSLFVINVLYFAVGRFIYKWKKKENTYYALTNKRALIYSDFWGKSMQAVILIDIPEIYKSRNKQGMGNIIFGPRPRPLNAIYLNTGLEYLNAFWYRNMFYRDIAPAFYDIKDVDLVFEKINTIRATQS